MTRPDLKIVSSIKEPQPADPHGHKGKKARYSNAAVGHRIRSVRITRGITESAAAAACKISLKTYRRWEAGGAMRGWLGQVNRLAELFDAHPCWLSLGSGDPPANPADGKVAFMSAEPSPKKTSCPGLRHVLSSQEFKEQYEAMTPYEKGYVVGTMDALTKLRGGPPPVA